MRLSVGALLRRARRVGFRSPRLRTRPRRKSKHIKIDDEERQSIEVHSRASPHFRILRMLLLLLLFILFFIILSLYIIYKPPAFVINFLQWKYPDVLFQVPVPPGQKIVALTLDDAPSSETGKILDLLKTYHAKATFFIIGSQVASRPDILQRIHDEGHEVGNHAWADEPSISLPLSELESQMREVEMLLPTNPGGKKYFRPGSGFFSKDMLRKVTRLGYKVALGGIFPHDPQIHSARINAAHVLSMVRPGGIIIMHDRRDYSVEQVERVLKGLDAGGWKVESLGGLLEAAEEVEGGGKKR